MFSLDSINFRKLQKGLSEESVISGRFEELFMWVRNSDQIRHKFSRICERYAVEIDFFASYKEFLQNELTWPGFSPDSSRDERKISRRSHSRVRFLPSTGTVCLALVFALRYLWLDTRFCPTLPHVGSFIHDNQIRFYDVVVVLHFIVVDEAK